MPEPDVCEQMRADWNRRAREDAQYYVAFGRRNQDEEEFLSSGRQLAGALAAELKRLSQAERDRRRALEIGCGLGRLMRPMSSHFAEIHGVDISEEMVRGAAERLRNVPNARVHLGRGSDLGAFEADSFAFIYSYAVFQHIPSREVVFEYLSEARRVLEPGGVFRFQLNGLPQTAAHYDTWCGVRIPASDISRFALDNGLQLLALEGIHTQYMWVTLRKPGPGAPEVGGPVRIRRITNAFNSEPVIPARGRFASAALWVTGLPGEADLNSLEVRIAGAPARLIYLGPAEHDGIQQLNVALTEGIATGLQPLEIRAPGRPPANATVRVIPPAPMVPRLVAVTDGIDLLSGTRVVSRAVKVRLEEVAEPLEFSARIDGEPVKNIDVFRVDPVPPLYEVNFELPDSTGPGPHRLDLRLGPRSLAPVGLEVI